MTIKELKELLEIYDENAEIVLCTDTFSKYAYEPGYTKKRELRSFWGKDRQVVCLFGGDQIGAI